MLTALGRAVQTLHLAGFDPQTRLREAQYAVTSTAPIPVHGGTGIDGTTNVVGAGGQPSTLEPLPELGDTLVPGSSLRPEGYPVATGTSFLLHVDYTRGDAPTAWAILTYGQSGNNPSPLNDAQTRRFRDKRWRRVAFTEAAIAADPHLTQKTVSA